MAERPILFSSPMVRAILNGRKTQTRRVVKPQPKSDAYNAEFGESVMWCGVLSRLVRDPLGNDRSARTVPIPCPYGSPGDTLWVRETWTREVDSATSKLTGRYLYAATDRCDMLDDGDGQPIENKDGSWRSPWKAPIHMPREVCRIVLCVLRVRVLRLQDITEADALAEGVRACRIPPDEYGPERIGYCFGDDDGRSVLYTTPIEAFHIGWDRINGRRSPWSRNDWVWVVTFERAG